ncbi:MAG: class I SAM-dependent methyltransferase [Patescibacteria group bacterium]|nr:class I SAM-dependent methyltransferase [Patescibacteria group bacterium]
MTQNAETIKRSVDDFYETQGTSFSSTRHAPWGVMKLVQESLKSGDVLVDFGAGNGRLGLGIPDSVRYNAVEPSSSLRAEAAKILAERKNVEIIDGGFVVGEQHATSIQESSADAIACLAVLHHIPTDAARRAAIAKLARILKPGGTLILTVWNLRCKKFFRNKTLAERIRIWLAAHLRLSMVSGGGKGDVMVSWKANGASTVRYVHAFTLDELKKLFDPMIWEIEVISAWGNETPTSLEEGRNLVVKALKKQ